jgi:carboxypeptidase Q
MKILLWISLIFIANQGISQNNDSVFIANLSHEALKSDTVMLNLKYLCESTPGRLLGTKASLKALNYLKTKVQELNPDTCFLQSFETPAWMHYSTRLSMKSKGKSILLHAAALGPSVGTVPKGIEAEVIEVKSFEELSSLGRDKIKGKIVFFNKVMSNQFINPFEAYGDAIKFRSRGAIEAARYGASAAIIRSLTTGIDTFPHTGKTNYMDTITKIPIVAVSTLDAEYLSRQLQENPHVQLHLTVKTSQIEKTVSYNLIADFRGKRFPDEYILAGAHVDTWYNTCGAHDDGAGCVQILEMARLFKRTNYQFNRSFRLVFFMDEELFQSGGASYASYTMDNHLKHYAALETDAGGSAPEFITVDTNDSIFNKISSFENLLAPYGLNKIKKGHSGVDIQPLKKFNVTLMGNNPQNQRYFDYHHCSNDTYNQVNYRELQMSVITMAGLLYLIDKNGF